MHTGILMLLGVVLVATRAVAVDVRVTYAVYFRDYKASVSQGDPLTFALYRDSGCTRLLHSQVVTAGAAIRQEKIFAQDVRQQSPRPVKEMRLHTTLAVPSTADAIFLKVTGAGIVPIEPACQPQAGQAGTAVPSLPVRNGNSVVIGQTSTPTATCGASSCSLSFTRTTGTVVDLNCTVTENSMGTTVSCNPLAGGGWTGIYLNPSCTQPVLEWPTTSTFSPTNLPADPPPAPAYNAGVGPGGIVLYSEAPMSSYSSVPVYYSIGYCVAFGTHLVITPQTFDPMTLNVPPFTVGP